MYNKKSSNVNVATNSIANKFLGMISGGFGIQNLENDEVS